MKFADFTTKQIRLISRATRGIRSNEAIYIMDDGRATLQDRNFRGFYNFNGDDSAPGLTPLVSFEAPQTYKQVEQALEEAF